MLVIFNTANIRRFYSKITGNQVPVHFPLFLQAPVHIFRNQAKYGSKVRVLFWSYCPSPLQKHFRVLSVNIILPYLDPVKIRQVNMQPDARYFIVKSTGFWPGLSLPRPKAIVFIPKIYSCQNHLRKKRVKVRSTPGHYATKKKKKKKNPLK